ncbi:ComF family protein [Verrucomicrobium sp. GAS474]|uniref:ComF family protein n=1 Tax=Verrucomicrobium sp. GAS474 TaxID=1882831 RepID=UPI000B81A234|nr:ComF family protein [Verrucomicrobium sp. GAS474]
MARLLLEVGSRVKGWGREALDLAFPPQPPPSGEEITRRIEPPFCARCGEPFPAPPSGLLPGAFLCGNCADRDWTLSWARAAWRAEGPIRDAIHDFKYRGRFHLLSTLADHLEDGFRQFAAGERWDGLVFVPLHPVRQRDRGFNQAEELCRELGKRQGLPLYPCLRRIRPTEKQAWLTRGGRLRNLTGAFAYQAPLLGINTRFDVKGLRLLLIDDVFTTGATAEACARVLRSEGVARIAALTVARA